MDDQPIELTTLNFHTKVDESALPFVVFFWADWCTLSRSIAPVVAELASIYRGRINVGRVDISAHPDLTNEHRIQDTPTLIFFHKGHVLRRLTGDANQGRLEEMFEQMAGVAAIND